MMEDIAEMIEPPSLSNFITKGTWLISSTEVHEKNQASLQFKAAALQLSPEEPLNITYGKNMGKEQVSSTSDMNSDLDIPSDEEVEMDLILASQFLRHYTCTIFLKNTKMYHHSC